ncbi:tRNA 2-thiouridine(34) synthase MnmA [Natronospira bacteriovora]|uniref:tRNA-specific 2-thiouridylase MnmA n=1 Tax=Natronospira bacteriovora TaxID=3069753 RepID=A0ABU0WCY1_9GAMM|nr:tRNA 2-thiouridine(34) synthase MnmA [Natronospira sp. AB-CW4]MDQ2070785.1 tRNA 2-thiouridine(34) synthase MnmA [Natronospira sp. AB-CW4]
MNSKTRQTVVVGLSGGVDSSVSAHLLVEQGYDVRGLFMDNWDADAEGDEGYCTTAEDFQDARRVAEELEIPIQRVSFAKEYRDRVFSYFLEEYSAGRTPNPDVLCNTEIKFKAFLDYALRLGADWIATGHYARCHRDEQGAHLLKGVDRNKDQTYFLHGIRREALAKALFPVGELQKNRVREIAVEAGLHNYAKRDSTGICFIGERAFRQFLANYLPASNGPIVTPEGQQIGEHHGALYYTIGQRQGLGIGGVPGYPDAPWYVADKNVQDNVLIAVQGHDHPLLQHVGLIATGLHWLREPPALPWRCQAKTRYRQADQDCEIHDLGNGRVEVRFDTPLRAVTPGQYVVFYNGDECLGGGVIDQALRREQKEQIELATDEHR